MSDFPEEYRRQDAEAGTGRKECGARRVERHVNTSGWECDEDGCDDPGQHPDDCERNQPPNTDFEDDCRERARDMQAEIRRYEK